jgi:hypothetical protein
MVKAKQRSTKTKKAAKTPSRSAKPKSGYAADIMPDRLEGDEAAGLAVPVATGKGRQQGRVSPAQRKYAATYEAVSAAEAQRRMMARTSGQMPKIEGGLDDDGLPQEVQEELRMTNDDFDPLGAGIEPGDPALIEEEKALAAQQAHSPAAAYPVRPERVMGPSQLEANPLQEYLAKRMRVTLELSDGAMALSAIDIKESRYGITILLPLLEEGVTFIPKPGSELTVVQKDHRWDCFFPGTHFEVEELKILGLVFVKKDEG